MAENPLEIYFSDHRPPLRERFFAGYTFSELLARPKDNGELWEAIYRRAQLADGARERAQKLSGHWHLLVLNEDWCGDSVNSGIL